MRIMSDHRLSRLLLPALLLALLVGCAGERGAAFRDNCDSPTAALYTQQCNPYRSSPGPN
jgi:hypothetical protein